jgi:hypothetical protein
VDATQGLMPRVACPINLNPSHERRPRTLAARPPRPLSPLQGRRVPLVAVARHSETHEPLVVYRPLYGEGGWWVRPHAMFFEDVEIDGRRQPRFAFVGP